jgi:hypothetical protein
MSQKLFINKKNIGYVNFLVTNALGLEDLTKDDKRFVIKELVSNMNYVYKKLNKRKISKKNFDGAFNKFNQLVFDRTVKSLKKNLEENEEIENINEIRETSNVDQLKMQRDQMNNTDPFNNVMNRPESQSQTRYTDDRMSNLSNRPQQQGRYNDDRMSNRSQLDSSFSNNLSGISDTSRTFENFQIDTKIDRPQYRERQGFVNSKHIEENRSDMSVKDRYNQLQQEREQLMPSQQRPKTPEFIRNNREQEQSRNVVNNVQMNREPEGQKDTFGFGGVSSEGNFGSLDSYGTELAPKIEIDESISVQDRMKQIEQERSSLQINYDNKEPIRNSSVMPQQQSMQQPMQQPMQQSIQQPMQQSMQQPMQQSMQQSMQQPMQSNMNNQIDEKLRLVQEQMQQQMQIQMQQQMQMIENIGRNNNTQIDQNGISSMVDSKMRPIMETINDNNTRLFNDVNSNIQNLRDMTTNISSKLERNIPDMNKITRKEDELNTLKNNFTEKINELQKLSDKFSKINEEVNKKIDIINNNNSTKEKLFLLDKSNYNDNNEFELELPSDLQYGEIDIKHIEIINKLNSIDNHNNKFYFNMKNNEEDDELDVNSLTINVENNNINSILGFLNKKLGNKNIKLFEQNDYVTIKIKDTKKNDKLNLYNLQNSILPTLGFTQSKYEGAITYKAENKYNLSENQIYHIYEMSNNKCVGKYSTKTNTIFMDENKYENLNKLRLKLKLENNFVLSKNFVKNIELGILYNTKEKSGENNTSLNEYSLNN